MSLKAWAFTGTQQLICGKKWLIVPKVLISTKFVPKEKKKHINSHGEMCNFCTGLLQKVQGIKFIRLKMVNIHRLIDFIWHKRKYSL